MIELDHAASMSSLSQIEYLMPELRAYATTISKSRDDAEDLVQDAIERALRAKAPPNKLEELRPWMFRVIRNLHYDELRKRRVRREYFAAEKRQSSEVDVVSDVARDVLIRMAFEKLAPETREILFFVDIMGLKYKEIAEILDMKQGTVMSRVSRARRALLDLVEGPAKGFEKDGEQHG
ncbi:RNA polymerase, sigma-24 subunit, ECF subfamily [Rhodobacteraceae bacterium KLH11]|nr:RNA polymerase, sigma-24 subunit, ECF subfamily [Rhodobacteraceae bacterium KLH11]